MPKEAMQHINIRLPKYVVEHYKRYPSYTGAMRKVLVAFVREHNAKEVESKKPI
jgi:hypothetical protein